MYSFACRPKHRPMPSVAGGGTSAFHALAAHTSDNGYSGSFSRAMNGGVALPACCVIIGITGSDSLVPGSPQIGGTAMTLVAANGSGETRFYAADVSEGNGDNFTLSNPGASIRAWSLAATSPD